MLAAVLPAPDGQPPTEVSAKSAHHEKFDHIVEKVKLDHQAPVHSIEHLKVAHLPKLTKAKHRPTS